VGAVAFVVAMVGLVLLSRPHVDRSNPWYDRGLAIGHGIGQVQARDKGKTYASVEDGCDSYFDQLVRDDDPSFGVPLPEDRPTFVSACRTGAHEPGPLPAGAPTPDV